MSPDAAGPLDFSAEGPLAAVLRARGLDPAARPAQRAFAAHLAACLEARRPAFIDAETGVGKTLGYLIPMLNRAQAARSSLGPGLRAEGGAARPILVVSTANVALQRQILEGDLAVALEAWERATGAPLRAALRVGRRQAVDPAALRAAAAELGSEADQALAEAMIDWCEAALAQGELPMRQTLLAAFSDRLPTALPWLSADLIGLRADLDSRDAAASRLFERRLEACVEADVLVVNHHLLALHLTRPFLWSAEREAFIVIDEADRLPSVVEALARSQIPLHRLPGLCERLGEPEESGAIRAALERMEALLRPFWPQPRGGGVLPLAHVRPAERAALLEAMAEIRARLTRLPEAASAMRQEERADLARHGAALDEILRRAARGDCARTVLYATAVRRGLGAARAAEGSARLIARRLWSDAPFPVGGLLFTSATLSTLASGAETTPRRALAGFLASCGFEGTAIDPASCALIAPERFGAMRFARPSLSAPAAFAQRPEAAEEEPELSPQALAYWRAMLEAASAEGGRILALLPAMRDVAALAEAFAPEDPRLVAQLSGLPTAMAVARFLARGDSIWISASAWEGISLPNAIAHIVIPRLPIRPRRAEDDLLERHFAERFGAGKAGEALVFGRKLADARRRLRQGIGRGIRAADDAVKIWIGDPRWPINQEEADSFFLDQPRPWSPTLLGAVPERFRSLSRQAPRFEAQSGELGARRCAGLKTA